MSVSYMSTSSVQNQGACCTNTETRGPFQFTRWSALYDNATIYSRWSAAFKTKWLSTEITIFMSTIITLFTEN